MYTRVPQHTCHVKLFHLKVWLHTFSGDIDLIKFLNTLPCLYTVNAAAVPGNVGTLVLVVIAFRCFGSRCCNADTRRVQSLWVQCLYCTTYAP